MLLHFFDQHRTALAVHVQRTFPDWFPTDRTVRMHLQTLVAAGDLTVVREQGMGRPNVYLLTQRGLRKASENNADLAEEMEQKRRRRPVGTHLVHELLITEIAVALVEAIRARPDMTLNWEDRFGLYRQPAFQQVIPDYAFLLQHTAGRLLCLVEVSSGEESSTRIGQKLQKYADWADCSAGQTFMKDLYRAFGAQRPRPQFRLLMVAQNRRTGNDATRLRRIWAEALRWPSIMRRMWGTTVASLAGAGGIDAPIWISGKDLAAAMPDWQALPRSKRSRHLASVVREVPRRRLLPLEKERTDHEATDEN